MHAVDSVLVTDQQLWPFC